MQNWRRTISGLYEWSVPLGAMAATACLRLELVARGSVPFNSDEAVVGLMARHILMGSRPVFFYGQAYLGSLDAWLVAGAFRLFGESVLALRGVQALLYLVFMLFAWLFAREMFSDRFQAGLVAWLLALPAVFVTTYTTASLGGYGELMALSMISLWLSDRIVCSGWHDRWAAWLVLGLSGGLAFWVSGLSVVFLLPVGLVILLRLRPVPYHWLALCMGSFLAGSSPWWLYNLQNGWAALHALSGEQYGDSSLWLRLAGLLLLGLPTLADIRFPWQAQLAPLAISIIGIVLFSSLSLAAGTLILRWLKSGKGDAIKPGVMLVLLQVLVFLLVFLLSRFGVDATGRYLLPLYFPFTLLLAWTIATLWRLRAVWGVALFIVAMALHGLQTWRAATSPDGLTTQFDPVTRFDNRFDAELIDFLEEQRESRGYTHYWVTFRLAFLSQERLIFAPNLPYKFNLDLSPRDNRLPIYSDLVNSSPRTAYLLTENPFLEERLVQGLSELRISYRVKVIGPYRIYYQLSQAVRPWQLGLGPKP